MKLPPQKKKNPKRKGECKREQKNRKRPDMEQGREARNNDESSMSMFL
jgi:hypothetical protein